MGFAFWDRLRRIAWPLVAGMVVALLLAKTTSIDNAWLAVWGVLVVAFIVTAIAARTEPLLEEARARRDTGLDALPPLARDVLERLPDPLMLTDATGRVMLVNRAMRGVIGVDVERRQPVSALVRTPSVLDAIRKTTETGETISIEFTLPVPIQRNYQATIARTGSTPAATILLLHDLTAMKRAEQMRADFVANASHELRTPLAALSGFIETLRGHAKEDPEAREQFLAIMTIEAERMRRLIDDLLSLTRIEQNEHVPPSGEVSLEIVLREAVAALTPLASIDNITLEMSLTPSLPPAVGERDELIQIFQNLIHNAIKYGKSGGHVWVGLNLAPAPGGRGAEQMLAASIRDDGEGIPAAAVPRLTERFYRVDVKRSREKGGTGLGLAIVKHIISRYQGRLTIDSKPGEGSTFTVFLPAARAKTSTEIAVTETS
jgi:two-component system phosphate regulon sensor histidine kinase PhoR